MNYNWNWMTFFKQDFQACVASILLENNDSLLNLSFIDGLEVIITNVPHLTYNEWLLVYTQLMSYCDQHQYMDYWLMIGKLIQQYKGEVEYLLKYGIEQGIIRMQQWLEQKDGIEQFSLMACLYYYGRTNLQAKLMFSYLLESYDLRAQQLLKLLYFYQNLTERQKDVVILTTHGLTNQEIADTLYIEISVVAEYLTSIFAKFRQCIPSNTGTRYRLIYWFTHLFTQHPYLLLNRDFQIPLFL